MPRLRPKSCDDATCREGPRLCENSENAWAMRIVLLAAIKAAAVEKFTYVNGDPMRIHSMSFARRRVLPSPIILFNRPVEADDDAMQDYAANQEKRNANKSHITERAAPMRRPLIMVGRYPAR
jgi:hypothetical protein